MSWFSSKKTTQEEVARDALDATSTRAYKNLGAEQDRYESHFGAAGREAMERTKNAALNYKGAGAEQDRYQSHFGLQPELVQRAAQSLMNARGSGAEQDRHEGHFGLGADGWARAKALAGMQGVGAEQDRYGGHFGLDKDTVARAAQGVRDGARDVLEKK